MTPDGRIRVLHMGLDDRKGGIESFLHNMAENIDWGRFQFDFLCYGQHPAYGDELEAMGARLVTLPSRKNLAAYTRVLNGALVGCDVLHLHKNSPLDFWPAIVGRHARARVVAHAHNTRANVGGVPAVALRMGRQAIARNSNLRLACSRPAGEWVFGQGAGFESFPNMIRLSDYAFDSAARGSLRSELGVPEGAFAVGIVGRLVEQKNHEFMLRTFALLQGTFPSVRLLVVGEGPLEARMRTLAAELGVAGAVTFLGRRDDAAKLYSALDCLCVPSLWEGFSFVTLEAQAAGLPCVVSDAVPPEARITSLVEGPLRLSKDLWASRLSALASADRPRSALVGDDLRAMRPFDVRDAAERLMRIYADLVDGNGSEGGA